MYMTVSLRTENYMLTMEGVIGVSKVTGESSSLCSHFNTETGLIYPLLYVSWSTGLRIVFLQHIAPQLKTNFLQIRATGNTIFIDIFLKRANAFYTAV